MIGARRACLIVAVVISVVAANNQSKAQTSTNLLAAKAAALSPGQWVLLNQEGDGSGYTRDLVDGLTPSGAGVASIFAYSQKAAYDPVARKVHFIGAPHGGQTEHIVYDIATNTWRNDGIDYGISIFPEPGLTPNHHSYDSNVIDTGHREFFVGGGIMPETIYRKSLDSGSWTDPASWIRLPAFSLAAAEYSLEYFPERDELLLLQTPLLARFDRASNSWKTITSNLTALGSRSPILRYNPVYKCVVMMGGKDTTDSPAVYKYAPDGTITRMPDDPLGLTTFINYSLVAADPVSGDYVFFGADGSGVATFKYNIATNQWANITGIVQKPPAGMFQ